MSGTSTWDFAGEVLRKNFAGIRDPLFFGDAPSTHEQIFVRGKPRPYLLSAVDLITKISGKTIVEVGCMRQPLKHSLDVTDPVCCNDGHSTIFWAHTGLTVHSVDINMDCCNVTASACQSHPNVHVYRGDGVTFLTEFADPIDLLYLDAWDAIDGVPFAEKHLEAYQAARKKLSQKSIVLIDDTDIAFGGKGRLAIPAIIRDGYDLLVTGRQTMLMRL